MTLDKAIFLKILGGLGIIALGVFVWRTITLWRLPYDEIEIAPLGIREHLDIPPRPGIQGVLISGPTIEPLIFSIDLSKAGVRSLAWQRLETIDPHTDVKVSGHIDNQGRLFISDRDVLMGGHTEAGLMIQRAMRTWMYTPFKSGRIRFWFNLPSKGKKLIIDTEGLSRAREVPMHVPIFDGRIHLIDGISPGEIQMGGTF
jgi:hypothetical protein